MAQTAYNGVMEISWGPTWTLVSEIDFTFVVNSGTVEVIGMDGAAPGATDHGIHYNAGYGEDVDAGMLARFAGAVNREHVAVENARITHALTAHAKQVVGAWRKKPGVDRVSAFDMFFGEHGMSGGHSADEGQAARFSQADAACTPAFDRDDLLRFECAQVRLCGIRRSKSKGSTYFRACRRTPFFMLAVANEIENFLLTRGESCRHFFALVTLDHHAAPAAG